VEREVPQTKERSKDAPHNVVRLWDWIGPHDELVPFGRRDHEHETKPPPEEVAPASFAASDAPPSAEDFWGERAGGLHDALEAPAEDRGSASAGDGSPSPIVAATPQVQRSGLRRAVVAAAAAIAVAAAVGVALTIASLDAGAPATPGATKAQVASVLAAGMNRILNLELPLTEPRHVRAHAVAARHKVVLARRTSHPHYVSEPVHYSPSPPITKAPPSYPSVEAAPAQAAPTTETNSRPVSSSSAPSAPVTATGQSGALGPIQSPNG
jgi:hypothetical protein